MRRALVAALLAVVVLWALPARANPLDAFGFGARAAGMGGAQTAATADTGANYYNPAAIAMSPAIQIDIGYHYVRPFLSMNDGRQDVDSSRGLVAGLNVPGHVGKVRIAFGLSVFLPDERITRTRTLPPERPRWQLYDNRPQRIFFGTNLAVRIADWLYLGGGIAYLSRTDGDLNLSGRVGFPDFEDSDLALDIDVNLENVRYPQAGILVRAQPWLDLGLAYRGEFVLTLAQRFRINGDVGAAGVPPVLNDGSLFLNSVSQDLFQPAQLAAGFSARITRRLLVAGDVTWQHWSAFDNPSARIILEYDLREFNDLVNIPALSPPLPKAYFHDILVPRIGFEYLAKKGANTIWMVRGGYSYEPSPALPQIGEANLVDNDKHTFSLGAGISVARVTGVLLRPFDIDIYLAGTFLPEREHKKLNVVDAVGDYVSSGFVLASGLCTSWRF